MARRPQSPRPTSSRGADGLKDGEAAGSILSKPLSEKDLSSSVSMGLFGTWATKI